MFDAAYPPMLSPDTDVAAGYIGGNTPHVWTTTEWDRQSCLWRLPIYTRSHDGDPVIDSESAVEWLQSHSVPKGCCLALDFETRIDQNYLALFDQHASVYGYPVIVYGSKSSLFSNPKPSGGYWVADYTGKPHLYPNTVITQWANAEIVGHPWDMNTVADSVPLWRVEGDDMPTLQEIHEDIAKMLSDSTHAYLPPVHKRLAAMEARLATIEAALQAGVLANLSEEQLDRFGTIAGTVFAQTGVRLSGTVQGTVDLGADAP